MAKFERPNVTPKTAGPGSLLQADGLGSDIPASFTSATRPSPAEKHGGGLPLHKNMSIYQNRQLLLATCGWCRPLPPGLSAWWAAVRKIRLSDDNTAHLALQTRQELWFVIVSNPLALPSPARAAAK
jgi:hypothetical protein